MKLLLKRNVPPNVRAGALCAALAYLGVWGMGRIAEVAVPIHSLLTVALFAALTLAGSRFCLLVEGRLQKYALVLGFAFVFFYGLGYQMRFQDGVGGWMGLGLVLLTAIGFAPGAAYGVACLYRACARLRDCPFHGAASPGKAFRFYFAVLLISWLPVFLAYYPGLFAYDVMFQIPQATESAYRMDSPLAHTLLLGAFYNLGGVMGSHTTGMALHTAFQMILHSLVLAYALTYLYRRRCPRAVRTACLLFFALCPIHSMMAVSMTKDVLYSGFLLLSLLFAHEAWLCPERLKEKKHMLRLTLAVTLTCLMRTNGVLVYGFLCVVLLFARPKRRNNRRMLALIFAGIALFSGLSLALSSALQARPGPIREGLSVPLQQMGRVYSLHQEELECKAQIEEFIPGVYAYVPTFADHIKAFANVGTDNGKDFLLLWARLFAEYPTEYLDAFLFNCQGYWFMDDLSHSQHYGVGLTGRQGYLLSDTKEGFGVEHTSYFPALEQLYEDLFSANAYLRIPVAAQIFSLALYTWLLAFLCFAAAYERRREILFCAVALFGVVGFLLLGPCAIVRYQYPLVLGVPILFGLLFGKPPLAHLEESEEFNGIHGV